MTEEEIGDIVDTDYLGPLIALRDFVIHHNEFHFDIKKGDALNDIPEMFHPNLKTEKVI